MQFSERDIFNGSDFLLGRVYTAENVVAVNINFILNTQKMTVRDSLFASAEIELNFATGNRYYRSCTSPWLM